MAMSMDLKASDNTEFGQWVICFWVSMFQHCLWKRDMHDTQVLFHFDLSLIFSILA